MNLWNHRFTQNPNKKLSGFLPCVVRAEIFTIFCSDFGRNDDYINSFWNWLTFTSPSGNKSPSSKTCQSPVSKGQKDDVKVTNQSEDPEEILGDLSEDEEDMILGF